MDVNQIYRLRNRVAHLEPLLSSRTVRDPTATWMDYVVRPLAAHVAGAGAVLGA